MCIRDRNMTVWRGGAAQRKGSGLDSSELYSNLIQIVDLFRGKSRLKIDLLMKEFMLHARTEGAAPPSSHEARVNCQGFRNFFKKKEIRDTELVDRLFRATDLDRNGQVSFTEFRRAIHKLRSGLEGRIGALIRIMCCAALRCAALRCVLVLRCAVLCCAVLCCAVLCCAVLCLSLIHISEPTRPY
eukprot:TRINITY_DN4459_c0_g1_i2.p1 TRINITY_DN4459_c0_g1~~TRINITY_DN4459_c0_g1_i2.p1  ORF type:complete len:186 (-),score=63.63 TRINITY_DN4459_c0_g1_i2:62-619(-)